MTWEIEYLPEVKKDIRRLSGTHQALVDKSIIKVIRTNTKMTIVVVGAREDEKVYDIAAQRAIKYNL